MENELQLIREMRKNGEIIRNKYAALQGKYPDRFIALYEGKVIDSDADSNALNARIEKEASNPMLVLVQFIPKVGAEILY